MPSFVAYKEQIVSHIKLRMKQHTVPIYQPAYLMFSQEREDPGFLI